MSLTRPNSTGGGTSTPAILTGEVKTFRKSKVPAEGWRIISGENLLPGVAQQAQGVAIQSNQYRAPDNGCGALLPNGDVLLLPSSGASGTFQVRKFRADTLTWENTGVSVAEVGTGSTTTEMYSNPVVIADTVAGGAACKIYHFAKSTDANQKSKLYTVSAAGAVTSVENLPQWPAANTSSSGVGPIALQVGANILVLDGNPDNTSGVTTARRFDTATKTWTNLAASSAYASASSAFRSKGAVFQAGDKVFCLQVGGNFAVYDVLANTWTINVVPAGRPATYFPANLTNRGTRYFKHPTLVSTWVIRNSQLAAETLTFNADGTVTCVDAPEFVSNLQTFASAEMAFGTVDGQKSVNLNTTTGSTNYCGTIKFFGEVSYGDPIVQAEKI